MDEKKLAGKVIVIICATGMLDMISTGAFARAGAIAGIIGRNKAVAYVQ